MKNRITELFSVQYPIVQAGMIWCSGWELASAVSNAGALGIIGAGSMYPDILRQHIQKCKHATSQPFAVNVPMLYPDIEQLMDIIIAEKVKIVFTSAGNPATWTPKLKSAGITVVHVISNVKFALKAQQAGVDAIVAEGFEAGGHNGREETTTLCLVPAVRQAVDLPLIAAGGISTGKSMLAAFALGAEAVQMGSRFVASVESSAHENFKQKVISCNDGDTMLSLKALAPVRLIKNNFYHQVHDAEQRCATKEELKTLLGRARAKRGMFEGDMDEGELEIGQVSSVIKEIKPAAEIVQDVWNEFINTKKMLAELF
ncbi:MAG TPA: nitronate monooxygenase [Bacteroidia bacterium]|nr:MAG: 2-nitropropane dioxygenase [Bacteroidetes bacterium OLB10]MCB0848691.1 nitronate monooxygenase [Bacteroidota bacterium]MCB8930254.1 nitronate monooxygenase [Bacteroidia bacterium]MCE7954180.1 nitronate monooxygenase [Bacteroidetes bacterium CHB6]OQB64338.1 MAG: Nitronate monooxygenase [Bacteroidetes bacterium ADurb.Bin141]